MLQLTVLADLNSISATSRLCTLCGSGTRERKMAMARSPESPNIESKLLSLPVEVHELIRNEILHNSSFITREVVLRNERQLNSHKFNYRADTLRPLIHSCRALRAAYISAYYEHVEVCIVRVGQVWFKHLAERLEMVAQHIMDPHMRQLVPQIRYERSKSGARVAHRINRMMQSDDSLLDATRP